MSAKVIRTETTRPRPAPYHPLHNLLDTLRDLQLRMKNTGGKERGMNVLEAYDTFIRSNETGRACIYAVRCKSLFKRQDYKDIRDIILKLADIIEEVEDPDAELLRELGV